MSERRGTWVDVVIITTMTLGALLACQASAGGGGDGKVNIDCEGQEDGVDCSVRHTQGSSKLEACWEVVFGCQNGTKAQASACQRVSPGETSQRRIPKGQVSGWDACDKAVTTNIVNVKVTAE